MAARPCRRPRQAGRCSRLFRAKLGLAVSQDLSTEKIRSISPKPMPEPQQVHRVPGPALTTAHGADPGLAARRLPQHLVLADLPAALRNDTRTQHAQPVNLPPGPNGCSTRARPARGFRCTWPGRRVWPGRPWRRPRRSPSSRWAGAGQLPAGPRHSTECPPRPPGCGDLPRPGGTRPYWAARPTTNGPDCPGRSA